MMGRAQRDCGLRNVDCGLFNPKSKIQNPKFGCRGQSTLEYILVLAAILVAVILGVNQVIKPSVGNVMQDASQVINDASDKLQTGLGLP